MALVVQKFGGSSLSDLERLGGVADWVVSRRNAGESLAIVVSAMGKTTEGLLSLARDAARARPGFEPPRRELDMLVSTGERVSMALLSIAIQARGVPAVSFTGSQSGIITTGRHFDARIVEVRPERVRAELERGKVVIVAGYQGMSPAREITTLGRGGSDTTAVALAAALAADRCEIYSDVDGVYSADPNRVPDARHLPSVDYATMEEMAEAGARVLNVHAVRAAREQGLVLLARRTSDFVERADGRETRVEPAAPARAAVVVNPALWLVYGSECAREPLSSAARELELPLRALDPGDELPLALVPLSGVPDPKGAERALERAVPGLSIVSGYAELSAVGPRAHDEHLRLGALERLQSVAPPLCVLGGTRRLSAIVSLDHVSAAEQSFHDWFVTLAAN